MYWFSNLKYGMFIPDSKSKPGTRKVVTDFLGLLSKFDGGNCQEVNKGADPHRQSMGNVSIWAFTLPGHKGTGKHTFPSLYQQLLAEDYY